MKKISLVASICLSVLSAQAEPADFIRSAQRIVFLGDSNTHAGDYVSLVETAMRARGISPMPELINLGLSSETCSGLSEPDHPFPRPD
ncbi:MAG: hypothetical protein AAF492_13685, partial [Verrucomicrobiota bacterium]